MKRTIASAALVAASLLIPATAAQAHVTLEVQKAPADSNYKAVIRVPHGCDGSPTTAVRVLIPEDVGSVKAMPKPGWQLTTVRVKLEEPYKDSHGNAVTERVSEIRWTGGRLLDENYDEFVMRIRLPNRPGETLYLPTVQECEKGVHRWIEIPAAGKTRRDYREPAPQLILGPKN